MKKQIKYFDIHEALNKTDLDGKEPSIYMITSNRSAGKTTGCLKEQLEDFKDNGRKGMLFYREKYEIKACHEIYTDVLKLYPNLGEEMTSERRADGLY